MKKNIISFVALFDALSQGSDRFKTIKGLTFVETTISEAVVSSDKYSISFAGLYNERSVIVKILLDPEGERGVAIMESLDKLKSLKFPFVSEFSIFKDELTLINSDGSIFNSDVVVVYDDGLYFDNFSEGINNSNIISDFANLYVELLNNNIIFDLFSFKSFRYDNERGVSISVASDFILTKPTSKDLVGFKNFLLMQLIYVIIIKLESIREDKYSEYESIDIDNSENFDLRRSDYFQSVEYCEKIANNINIIKKYSDIDIDLLNSACASSKISDVTKIISNLVDVNDLRTDASSYRNNRNYDITGEYSENRIAIRDNSKDKFGYLSFDEELVIDFKYDEVSDFNEEFAVCRIGEYYGVINREDEIILEFKYDELEWDSLVNTFVWKIGTQKGMLKRKDIIKICSKN